MTSTPRGIDCGTTCETPFPLGASVTLTARPTGGAFFSGWSGPCVVPSANIPNVCVVPMTAEQAVTAGFAFVR